MSYKTAFRLSLILRNCANISATSQVKQAHAQIIIHGFLPDTTLQTDLILAYSRYGHLHDARNLFDKMTNRNMHSWNILIVSYVHCSLYYDALSVFHEFREMGFRPDHYTLPAMLKTSLGIGNIDFGKMLHSWVIKLGFEEYVVVSSSILDFYAKCGVILDARRVFSNMQCKDLVVWNSMISGFGKAGLYSDALNCFRRMLDEGVKMDCMTFPSTLNACGGEGDLMKGKEIHGQIIKNLMLKSDIAIGNSLIDMYAKCGSLNDSEKVFQKMESLNLVTWTTMISCYGVHGKGEKSLTLFNEMRFCGFKPNNLTITAILASCSHSGLIDQGRRIFKSISSNYGFEPSVEHCACMVDLLGRFGYLQEALELIKNMNFTATASIWGALLAGCLMHSNVEIGEIAAFHLFELEPINPSNYIALCGIYESLGILHGVSLTRMKMRNLGLSKVPGCSWINTTGTVHKFYQGDCSQPLALWISETLDAIIREHVLNSDCGLHN